MRLFGKAYLERNNYPWIGTFRLMKDAEIRTMPNGNVIWRGFGAFEDTPKNSSEQVTMGLVANGNLATMLVAWPKGTTLAVMGESKKSQYWSQRNGKDVYEIHVKWIAEQLNYAALYNQSGTTPEADASGLDEIPSNYDPGF